MTCPICGVESVARYRPFCSRRCADIDLGKWMQGGYAVPSADQEDVGEAMDDIGLDGTDGSGKVH